MLPGCTSAKLYYKTYAQPFWAAGEFVLFTPGSLDFTGGGNSDWPTAWGSCGAIFWTIWTIKTGDEPDA